MDRFAQSREPGSLRKRASSGLPTPGSLPGIGWQGHFDGSLFDSAELPVRHGGRPSSARKRIGMHPGE